jgi:hypothetical protein
MTIIDVLMITHRRPDYTRLALSALAESVDDTVRIWVWHNGDDEATFDVVKDFDRQGLIHRLHRSPVNAGLRDPTNWLWFHSDADYVSKVDDDCIVDPNLWRKLRAAHGSVGENAGVLAAWRFLDEDFAGAEGMAKVQRFGRNRLLRNHWVQGSSYLVRRDVVRAAGGLRPNESFPDLCIRIARSGRVNGWLFPFVHEEHMDDPRSVHSMLTSQAAFEASRPLHAILANITSLADWSAAQHAEAIKVQEVELRYWGYDSPFRTLTRKIRERLSRMSPGRRN